jgi:ribonuclease D
VPFLVESPSDLDDVVAAIMGADRYAIDTEFHRERTYFPQVALVQIAWDDQVALIDPLQVDLKPMAKLLDGPGLCILHAGVQDLEVLDLATGSVPQPAAGRIVASGCVDASDARRIACRPIGGPSGRNCHEQDRQRPCCGIRSGG